MNAQDVYEKLEPRVRVMEGFRWWIKGGLAGLAIAAVQAVYLIFYLHKEVALHEHRLTANEKLHAKLESQLTEHRQALEHLRRNIVVLWDRQPKGPQKGIEAFVLHGRVEDVSRKSLTVLPKDLAEPAYQFTLSDDLPIRVNGKHATIGDALIGMQAGVVILKGTVSNIDFDGEGNN